MKQIRTLFFETNSSSTHSVCIHVRKKEEVVYNIPRNSKSVFEIPEYKCSDGDEVDTITNVLMSEVYKTSFVLNTIGRYLEKLEDYSDDFPVAFSKLCDGKLIDLNDPDEVREAIGSDLIYTKWLKDVVHEETGTKIEFSIVDSEETYKYFPYITTPYSESSDSDEFFNEILESLENNDECKFKSLCREIIFNKEIIIEDKDEAYGASINTNLL